MFIPFYFFSLFASKIPFRSFFLLQCTPFAVKAYPETARASDP